MSNPAALKLLFELRAVLDRLDANEDLGANSSYEALAHDVDRAIQLTDSCIAHLTQEGVPMTPETEQDGDI